jgi:L-asparaginase II
MDDGPRGEAEQHVGAALVELTRGGVVDEIHRGHLAVVAASGELRFAVGDPERTIALWRSAAKPFQAMPLIAGGGVERFALSTQEIALTAASHGGEPVHVHLVEALLDRAGHRVEQLACGAHAPLDADAARELVRRDEDPTALHNNCSGKHAGMLALADQLGAPAVGYRKPDHPVQRTIIENVCRFTRLEPRELVLALDGCGVPSFGISVYRMALAFARLMAPPDDVPEPYRLAAAVVREAMMEHPYLVAGRSRLDTELMQAMPGAILAKSGAGGVQCIGLPGGVGLAVKIEDGASSAASGEPSGVAALAALRDLGALDEARWHALRAHAAPVVRSVAGEHAGDVRATFELRRRAG